ncbi:hypothetical protein ACRRTK_008430 [Alexandromys fortis]
MWESRKKIGLHCGGDAAPVRPPPPRGGPRVPGDPAYRCFSLPLTLLALQGSPAGNQSRAGGFLKAQGDIWGQTEARPGCSAGDAGAAGSWVQALL